MLKKLIGLVLGCVLSLCGGSNATAQSMIYYQFLPSSGTTKAEFTQWLNNERSLRGLSPVTYDESLDPHSRWNSYLQSVYGLGHHYLGPARRQNSSAVPDFSKVGTAWMQSLPHMQAMMDPTITRISVEMYGIYTTFSAY